MGVSLVPVLIYSIHGGGDGDLFHESYRELIVKTNNHKLFPTQRPISPLSSCVRDGRVHDRHDRGHDRGRDHGRGHGHDRGNGRDRDYRENDRVNLEKL